MRYSVCYNKVGKPEFHIVFCQLVKDSRCYLNCRGFALNCHQRISQPVTCHYVHPSLKAVHAEHHLNTNQGSRVSQIIDHIINKVLPHPLFGSQGYITPANGIINLTQSILSLL